MDDIGTTLSDVVSGKSKIGDGLLNLVTQIGTGGLIGFSDGKFGQGWSGNAIDEGVGEVTGRNVAREGLYQQQRALEAEVARREEELQNQMRQNQNMDIQASNAAGALRTGSNRSTVTNAANTALERDFLGL